MNFDYRRHLPHRQPDGSVLFVTFRTAGSLPVAVLDELRARRRSMEKAVADGLLSDEEAYLEERRLFGIFDRALDMAPRDTVEPFTMLHKAEFAPLMLKSIRNGAALGQYILHRFCVMSNHAHLLIEPLPVRVPEGLELKPKFPGASQAVLERKFRDPDNPDLAFHALPNIMKGIKGVAAREINKALGRSGTLFQQESFDHVVRDAGAYERIVAYIDENPVKAGLVGSVAEYRWRG